MTLIELVVALAITGLTVGVGYSTFATLADRRMATDDRADADVRVAGNRAMLVSWLENARLTIEEDEIVFRGLHGVWHEPLDGSDVQDDELTFLTSARTPLGNHGTIVRLHVERSDSAGPTGLVADLLEWPGTIRDRILLDPTVGAATMTYLATPTAPGRWLTSWVSTTILPAGLRVTLSARRGDSLPPALRVPITVSLDNGR